MFSKNQIEDFLHALFAALMVAVWTLVVIAVSMTVILASHAWARPGPQWDGVPENIRAWFQSLMQPDNPAQSCCGEADAFEADQFEVEGDHYVAIITDGRNLIAPGTRIPVPNKKVQWTKGNPTGHGIIFLSGSIAAAGDTNAVIQYGQAQGYTYVNIDGALRILYCYVPPGGV